MNAAAAPVVQVLPALDVVQSSPGSRRAYLIIRHPGYPDDESNNVLLTLPATDGTADAPGIQYGLVHTACAIIANNRFDGQLTTSRHLPAADEYAAPPFESLLPAGDYYFHLSSATCPADVTPRPTPDFTPPYAVVPNFAHWHFPHDRLPTAWRAAPIAPAPFSAAGARARDVTCRLTKHDVPVESAHILPAAEKTWFGTNGMERYAPDSSKRGEEIVNAEENMVLLRQDIHTLWDSMRLSIVPKADAGGGFAWAVHLNAWSPVLYGLYHHRGLHPLAGVQREYLFARFAWDIFPKLQPFLQKHVTRNVVVRDGARSSEFCADDLDPYCRDQGRLRSSRSPRKASSNPSKRMRSDDGVKDVQSFDSGIGRWLSEAGEAVETVEAMAEPVTYDNAFTSEESGAECDDGSLGVDEINANGENDFDDEENDVDDQEDVDDEADHLLRLRRREVGMTACEPDNDLFGSKRRREVCEGSEDEWEAEHRGRKRWRSR
ncbi:uncharacterized protein MYCGRDRAFT_98057 [Zymoseptoria tritici IPO323]|uniref:HNH nuclease domain-containing protein n=1 Tax=Zymoseptoria tritici (strain CBS 115943 / IPO323) TaxID=336722 RepID=F9XS67_ZYMTI|nr:uncharacterized protein MYCGRDRAFT_98057 [Zymoseptoria tritici IPO323]EGP81914.1 hypothetical protein MYCGRDRAFT_98057 [Zymoseptoria tritici IPO323]